MIRSAALASPSLRRRRAATGLAAEDQLDRRTASILQDVTTDAKLQDAWFEIILERLHVTGAEEAHIRS